MDKSKRGFASMDPEKRHEIATQGGQTSSAQQDMSKLGRKGAAAQPIEAKRRGGQHSHRS